MIQRMQGEDILEPKPEAKVDFPSGPREDAGKPYSLLIDFVALGDHIINRIQVRRFSLRGKSY